MTTTKDILTRAKRAAASLSLLDGETKNKALLHMADALEASADDILAANALDIAAAKESLGEVMIDRLRLDKKRIAGMAKGIREVAALPDPLGRVLEEKSLANGLSLKKVSVPLGVVGIIYESRPNVTSDAGALCFKSGNVSVLRGGKEAFRSSFEIVKVLRRALADMGLEENYINIIEDTSRESASTLMCATDYVDALIPRGGAGLIRACVENAKVPCIQTGTGICHIYVDKDADLDMALNIVENAKTSRPSVCNAAEVCLVHKDIAPAFLPLLKNKIGDRVELRLCARARAVIDGRAAADKDFDTEFLDYILAVGVVDSAEEAICHIANHSTHHSECIVTKNEATADLFTRAVDSAAVYVNASTRFTDGGEFGLGCEIGISTQKLHARGPMGLCELCSYKYIVKGSGQIR